MLVATKPRLKVPPLERPGVEWEETACPLCQNERSAPVLEAADNDPVGRGLRFAVVQCGQCGLCYTNPRPSPASIGQFYADDYGPHRAPHGGRVKTSFLFRWLSRLIGRPCPEPHRIPMQGRGRLLDFGCGGGEFLLRMRGQGWQVTGLDTSAKVIRFLGSRYGLPGHVGTLPHPDLAPGSFDVVTMWAVLEHVHRPLEVLRAAHRLLTPGGRLYVQVPNYGSWDRRLFGPHWFSLDLPRHLTHFNPETLKRMLQRAGFQASRLRQITHPSATQKSLRLATRAGAATWGQRALAFKPVCLSWSWLAYVAGAGDHLFACAERPA